MDINSILLKINQQNCYWSETYSRVLPDLAAGRRRHYSHTSILLHSILLRLTLFILRLLHVNKPPKYIFQGLRHRALIEVLPASEVMVIGGRDAYLYCIKRGCRFHWVGYIAKSFQLYIGTGKKEALSGVILFIRELFSIQAGEQRYLFLYEDSLPAGITLSAILDSVPGVNVVCVAHGFFPRYYGNILPPEGAFCKFNLVWDISQKGLFKGGDDPATFVLGLPYEVMPPCAMCREVVLVGHCGLGADAGEYLYSLYHFRNVFTILQRAGFTVTFRPHPQDDIEFIRSVFPSVCVENKQKLFASGRRAFVGFVSSLMYEAKQFGNIIVVLDGSLFPYKMDYPVDGVVLESDYGELPVRLSSLFDAMPTNIDTGVESLSSRFLGCIKQIDEFNANEERRYRVRQTCHHRQP